MPPGTETLAASNATLLKLGRELVPRLAICLRTTKLYDSANVNVREAARETVETIRAIHRMEGKVQLSLILDFLTLNDVRLKTSISGHGTFRYMIDFFEARKLGGIHLGQDLTAEELIRFCRVLHDAVDDEENPYLKILDGMEDVLITSVTTEVLGDSSDMEIDDLIMKDLRQRSIRTFFNSIQVAREILVSTDPRKMRFKRAKRVVQQMVDLISEDESVMLSLTSIKNHDEYTYNHSANVAVYCIAFGQKMGFEKKALADLGMAGMFHDVGKTRVPKEILNKPGRLSPDEWEIMKNHSVYGAEILLRSRELTDATIRNILVAFEHHLNLDLGGYPNLSDRRDLNLYSKIVAIADCFDALTTPRSYRNRHYSPQEALGIMMEGRGTIYHPTLLKIFVSALGLYPVGSIVELDSGEMAVVVRPSEKTGGVNGLPQVKIFADPDGERVPPRLVDLSRLDEDDEPPLKIVRAMDPGDCFDSIEEYLEIL
jgi:HD-GYP domain-containing protein (c-di-GMP phosphodiesterase class II)